MTEGERYSEQGLRLARHVRYITAKQDPVTMIVCLADLCAIFLESIPDDERWKWRKELFSMIDDLIEIDGKGRA